MSKTVFTSIKNENRRFWVFSRALPQKGPFGTPPPCNVSVAALTIKSQAFIADALYATKNIAIKCKDIRKDDEVMVDDGVDEGVELCVGVGDVDDTTFIGLIVGVFVPLIVAVGLGVWGIWSESQKGVMEKL